MPPDTMKIWKGRSARVLCRRQSERREDQPHEMTNGLKKTMESTLPTVQKIDARKTFVLPTLDFMIFNGDVGEKQLTKMDKYI
jgi:hypothetical protein